FMLFKRTIAWYDANSPNYSLTKYISKAFAWELSDSTVYFFNAQNQPTIIERWSSDGSPSGRRSFLLSEYTYDNQGRLIEDLSFPDKTTYTYFANGDLKRQDAVYSQSGIMTQPMVWTNAWKRIYAYDRVNNIVCDSTWLTDINGNFWNTPEVRCDRHDPSVNDSSIYVTPDFYIWKRWLGNFYYRRGEGKLLYSLQPRIGQSRRDSTHYYYSKTYALSLEPESPQATITISPNPSPDVIHITMPDMHRVPTAITIRDIQGKVVKRSLWVPGNPISIQDFPSGCYTIEVFQRDGALVGRFVKN
ncbi:MAG: T9SS type A sorting domain-containing protein, partial [Bacteroidia bacterium]